MIEVIGHQRSKETLTRWLAAGRLPQALLLHGEAGIGKGQLAFWLAQRILCRASDPVEACGQCRDCHLIARLSHPAVRWVFPTPPAQYFGPEEREAYLSARAEDPWVELATDRSGEIRIDEVRGLVREAGMRAWEGGSRVFLLTDADRLNREAANALLKLLEEPPAGLYLVLTSSRPAALPTTVLSRCRRVACPPLSRREVEEVLASRLGPEVRALAELADGAPQRALRMSGEEGEALLRAARALLEAAREEKLTLPLDLLEEVEDADWEDLLLACFVSLRHELKERLGARRGAGVSAEEAATLARGILDLHEVVGWSALNLNQRLRAWGLFRLLRRVHGASNH